MPADPALYRECAARWDPLWVDWLPDRPAWRAAIDHAYHAGREQAAADLRQVARTNPEILRQAWRHALRVTGAAAALQEPAALAFTEATAEFVRALDGAAETAAPGQDAQERPTGTGEGDPHTRGG